MPSAQRLAQAPPRAIYTVKEPRNTTYSQTQGHFIQAERHHIDYTHSTIAAAGPTLQHTFSQPVTSVYGYGDPRQNNHILSRRPGTTKTYTPHGAAFNAGPHFSQSNNFPNAHGFVIENFYALDREGTQDHRKESENNKTTAEDRYKAIKSVEKYQRKRKAEEALMKLAAKATPGAMLDSAERGYIPRCDETTRESLRDRLTQWARNIDALEQCLLWLSGPAAVGKSAVAQSVAETMKEEELFGASFFFSRPNNLSDPDVVIPTLVYQLASLLPKYGLVVGQVFKDDPQIMNRSRRSQFRKFITEPFLPDLTVRPFTLLTYLSYQVLKLISHRPLLIVLDGLDECNSREAQCEFVDMISRFVHKDRRSRLRWMICSRPEPHLAATFGAIQATGILLQEKLDIGDHESRRDTLRILMNGFAEIRKGYPYLLNHSWPHGEHIHFIAEQASGHLGFVSFIIRFIGDKEYDNPARQLEVCLNFLKHASRNIDRNPLHTLDLLYTQILSEIPRDILADTLLVLGVFVIHNNAHLTANVLANFLELDQASFYGSLQRLHSVVWVPSPDNADRMPIRIYHASFSDYLKDQARSRQFRLDSEAVNLHVATRGLRWLSHFRKIPGGE
ncbi:hypothetical protein NP233_g5030 [Leucocoprinus birnbaumii]|uniref:Nephrocystin 3-like N-terminal domain-containing protein n=1 Tax=Leucocoprinus birnbaumii TaxID=56174 RepID=A0AAD5YX32_9AGAR|nr:hypothetical protein NP233_g5030 [Leucocoprinus birnbaumii]